MSLPTHMSLPLRASPQKAQQLANLLAGGGLSGPLGTANGGDQPLVWLKTTSGIASGGWYPAVTSEYVAGSWADRTLAVEVRGANGETLASGDRYLGRQTGPATDGTPRFVVTVGGPGGTTRTKTLLADVTCSGGSLVKTYETITYTDPT